MILPTRRNVSKMKVNELKEGMLLRFKEERLYRFLYDESGGHWFDCGLFDEEYESAGNDRPTSYGLFGPRKGAVLDVLWWLL